jgi:hypothetical protein
MELFELGPRDPRFNDPPVGFSGNLHTPSHASPRSRMQPTLLFHNAGFGVKNKGRSDRTRNAVCFRLSTFGCAVGAHGATGRGALEELDGRSRKLLAERGDAAIRACQRAPSFATAAFLLRLSPIWSNHSLVGTP